MVSGFPSPIGNPGFNPLDSSAATGLNRNFPHIPHFGFPLEQASLASSFGMGANPAGSPVGLFPGDSSGSFGMGGGGPFGSSDATGLNRSFPHIPHFGMPLQGASLASSFGMGANPAGSPISLFPGDASGAFGLGAAQQGATAFGSAPFVNNFLSPAIGAGAANFNGITPLSTGAANSALPGFTGLGEFGGNLTGFNPNQVSFQTGLFPGQANFSNQAFSNAGFGGFSPFQSAVNASNPMAALSGGGFGAQSLMGQFSPFSGVNGLDPQFAAQQQLALQQLAQQQFLQQQLVPQQQFAQQQLAQQQLAQQQFAQQQLAQQQLAQQQFAQQQLAQQQFAQQQFLQPQQQVLSVQQVPAQAAVFSQAPVLQQSVPITLSPTFTGNAATAGTSGLPSALAAPDQSGMVLQLLGSMVQLLQLLLQGSGQ